MAQFLSKADIAFLSPFTTLPALVSAKPMIRRQGNGNFTGLVRKTYADGSVTDCEFVVNAKSREDVLASYNDR